MTKSIYGKFIGGNIGGGNLITSTEYKYDSETFEYKTVPRQTGISG